MGRPKNFAASENIAAIDSFERTRPLESGKRGKSSLNFPSVTCSGNAVANHYKWQRIEQTGQHFDAVLMHSQ